MKTGRLRFNVAVALATASLSTLPASAQPQREDPELKRAQEKQMAQQVQEAIKMHEKAMKKQRETAQAYMGNWLYPTAEVGGGGHTRHDEQFVDMNTHALSHDSPAKVWKWYLERFPLLDKNLANVSAEKASWDVKSAAHWGTTYHDGNSRIHVSLPAHPRSFGTIFIHNDNQEDSWVLLITVSQRKPETADDEFGTTVIELTKRQLRPAAPVVATIQQAGPAKPGGFGTGMGFGGWGTPR